MDDDELYKNEDGELVALSGQEIGQLMAQALEGGAIEKPPWYAPFDGAPKEPVIKCSPEMEFDSLVVDAPSPKVNRPAALRSVPFPISKRRIPDYFIKARRPAFAVVARSHDGAAETEPY
jgi:hypothetical protein